MLTISETSTADYTPPEAGTYAARCCSIIDLGTQSSTWEGEAKTAHKVMLSFEVTDTDNRRVDGSPHMISRRFTASLHAKAGLRKFLEAWRGRPFTPEELAAFDLKTLAGLPCLVGIVHETKGDKTYANLASVMKLPKGMAAGAGELPAVVFDLAAPDWPVYARLSSRLQGQIAESPEYKAIPNKPKTIPIGAAPAPAATHVPPAPQQRPSAPPVAHAAPAYAEDFSDFADDCPF